MGGGWGVMWQQGRSLCVCVCVCVCAEQGCWLLLLVQPHALACSHGPHIFQPGKAPNTKPPLKCAHPFVGPCRRTRCSRTLWAALTTVRVVRPAVTLAQLSLPSSQVRCGHIPYNILSGAVT